MSQHPPSEDAPRGRPSTSAYDASPYDHELSTDPGRPHAYESLYRGSQERGRPTPRHWEPSLNPPDAPEGDDTYGWLYRPETSESEPRPGPVHSPVVPPPAPRAVGGAASHPVDRRPTPAASARRAEPAPPPARKGRRVLVVLLVVLILGALAAAGMIWQS